MELHDVYKIGSILAGVYELVNKATLGTLKIGNI